MPKIKEQKITDSSGKEIAVVLDIETYNEILEKLEDLDDLKAFEEGKDDKTIPYSEVRQNILNKRKINV